MVNMSQSFKYLTNYYVSMLQDTESNPVILVRQTAITDQRGHQPSRGFKFILSLSPVDISDTLCKFFWLCSQILALNVPFHCVQVYLALETKSDG